MKKKIYKKENGITLMALVITIIALLILAGVAISMLNGDNGILSNAVYAKFITEVKGIEDQVKIKKMDTEEEYSGSINDLLNIDSEYNDRLTVEDGELKYIVANVSTQEEKWLKDIGILAAKQYYTVEFITLGGTEIATQTIEKGGVATRPDNPIKEGCEFTRWYYIKENGSGDNITSEEIEFDFNTIIDKNYSLYAFYSNEAILKARVDGQYFWAEDYITKITSIQFKKGEMSVPTDAVDLGNIEKDSNCSPIKAYLESDGSGEGNYKLTIISPKTIYANPNMTRYFMGLSKLRSIDFSNFNTTKTTTMASMFNACEQLENLELDKFNTSQVTSMDSMFRDCEMLTELDLSGFDVTNIKSFKLMFFSSGNLKRIEGLNFDTSGGDVNKTVNMSEMFHACNALEELDLSKFNTSKVDNMSLMFKNCNSLTKIKGLDNNNLNPNFDTSNVTTIYGMFVGCKSLTELNVSGFNTGKVTNMRSVFQDCQILTKILGLNTENLNTNFVTNIVEDMQYMFYNCAKLTELNVSNFITEKVGTNGTGTFNYMFYNCNELQELNVSNFDISNSTSLQGMFSSCDKLIKIDLSNFDTSSVSNLYNLFYGCMVISEITLGEDFLLTNETKIEDMFKSCSKLTNVYIKNSDTYNILINSTNTGAKTGVFVDGSV